MDPEREIKHRLVDRRDKVLHFRLTEEKGMRLQNIVLETTGTSSLRKFMEEVVIPIFTTIDNNGIQYHQPTSTLKYDEPFLTQLKGCAKNLNQFMAFLNTMKKQGAASDDKIEGYCQRISRILDNLKIIMESEDYHIDQ